MTSLLKTTSLFLIDPVTGLSVDQDPFLIAPLAAGTEWTGTDKAESKTGTDGEDILRGGGGADTLIGGAGNDALIGGTGVDRLIGGAGNDIYGVDDARDIIVEAVGGGFDRVSTTVSYTLAGGVEVEELQALASAGAINLTGNEFANTLVGNDAANVLNGGAGDDTLDSGAGSDTLYGGAGNDYLYGGPGIDYLFGGAGADTLNGGSEWNGAAYWDYVAADGKTGLTIDLRDTSKSTGDAAGDVYIDITAVLGSEYNDVIYATAAIHDIYGRGGDDTIYGSGAADYLNGQSGDDEIYGDVGADVLVGEAGNDVLYGGADNDQLFGGAGDDTLNGGTGADVYNGGSGIDLVSYEGVSYRVTVYMDDATKNSGEAANDTFDATIEGLIGTSYDDVLCGNDSDNTLDGSSGNDVLAGRKGSDTYFVDSFDDVVIENANEGFDTIITSLYSYSLADKPFIEALQAAAGDENIWLTGNDAGNKLVGNDGANVLDGGLGIDWMAGGKGDDTYIIDNADDVVIERAGEGNDTIKISASSPLTGYTLLDGIERLSAWDATHGITLMGNALDNQVFGSKYNDTIKGGLGADTMSGWEGDDLYFVDNTGDTIEEFADATSGTDTVITTINYTLPDYVENLSAAASTANLTLTGNSLDNRLTGNDEKNVLDGKGGNDSLIGGLGNDVLTGGLGADFFVFNTTPHSKKNVDKITDFVVADDTIVLSGAVFTKLGAGGPLSTGHFIIGSKAKDADDYLIYNKKTGALIYDANGSAAGGAVTIAKLQKGLLLTDADFIIG